MADYLVNSAQEQASMLARLGLKDGSELFSALPEEVRLKEDLRLPAGLSELELMKEMRALAEKNRVFETVFRGAGAYRHAIPAAVNHLASRSEYVTSYTPYQPELSQGALQTIFEFQTCICELTGLAASNASVYDGATAAGEAVLMCAERKRRHFLISSAMHPGVQSVVRTYCEAAGYSYSLVPLKEGKVDLTALSEALNDEVAALLLDQINYFGLLEEVSRAAELCRAAGVKLILNVNPLAAAILPSAADCGADVAVGEAQPLGIPLSCGGPYVGFMACTQALLRRLPGRVVGQSVDMDGKRCYVLTLQAREQHIRRDKAISSICSNQALMAVRATIYLAMLGPEGLAETAQRCVDHAHYLADLLCAEEGFELSYPGEFFHEFVLRSKAEAADLERCLLDAGILPGLVLSEHEMLWCATECNTAEEMQTVLNVLKEAGLC